MNNPSALAREFLESGRLTSCPIIDTHTHMGPIYGLRLPNSSVDDMVKSMDRHNVEFIITAPHSALFATGTKNSEAEAAMRKYPGRIRGYFCFNPNYPNGISEIEAAFRDHPGYVGFKILPDYHKTRLDGGAYRAVFDYASERGLPVLSHTWGQAMYDGNAYSGIPMIRSVLSEYPKLVFIMGHSAQGQCDEAIEVAVKYENAYLELTDTYRINGLLEKMCRRAGSKKVLFGTDLPWYSPAYCLGCILFARITDEEKRDIIRGNILRILGR